MGRKAFRVCCVIVSSGVGLSEPTVRFTGHLILLTTVLRGQETKFVETNNPDPARR